MDQQRWFRLQASFDKYVDWAAPLRRAALEVEQPDDPAFVEEVLALCSAADEGGEAKPPDLDSLLVDLPEVADPYLHRTLGKYRLDHLLGHGGMGRVYQATRLDYGGVVALKILHERAFADPYLQTLMASKELHAALAESRRDRFLQEEKNLAKLNHPAIARLMDAGSEPDGTLYFVMELVEGSNLLDHCTTHKLDLRKRLELFTVVCDAVQYAHQRSVVHRDLKPSNILVTGQGQVKLLDFGISESLQDRSSAPGDASSGYMTLAYAAPEQVEHAPAERQADIYALGVVLQQLLTGQLPFVFEGKQTEEVRQMILHALPRPPSSVGTKDFAGRAEWQDLDAVCERALRKDPAERYGSVEALAADLIRFLGFKPLVCRQPCAPAYSLRKFFRRNRTSLLVSAGMLLLVFSLIGFYTYRLKVSRDEALSEAQRAREAKALIIGIFKGFDPGLEKVSKDSAVAILIRGEKEARLLRTQPLVQADIFGVLGTGFENLGEYKQAEELFRSALALREQAYGKGSPDTVEDLVRLSELYDDTSQFQSSEQNAQAALEIARRERPAVPSRVAKAEVALGNVFNDTGKSKVAVSLFEDALHSFKETGDGDAQEDCNIGLSIADTNLGDFQGARLHNREALRLARLLKGENNPDVAANLMTKNDLDDLAGQPAEAEKDARGAALILREWLGPQHPQTIDAERILAQDLNELGRYAEARTILAQALLVEEKWSGPQKDLPLTLNALGSTELQLGKYNEAEDHFRRAIEVYRVIYRGKDYKIGITLYNLAKLDLTRKRFQSAEQESREALSMLYQTMPADHPRVAKAEALLGRILAYEDKDREAEGLMLKSYGKLQRQKPEDAQTLDAVRYNLHSLYLREGNASKARLFADAATHVTN